MGARAIKGHTCLILEGAGRLCHGVRWMYCILLLGSQENLKIDYDRLVNVTWNCTILSFLIALQVPFLKGRVVYTAHECPCGAFDLQAFWDRWSWLLQGTRGLISIWSPVRVLSPFPSSTVSTIDHSPCLQPTLKPWRLYAGLIVAAFPACWCSSETFKRSCQNNPRREYSLLGPIFNHQILVV